MADRVLTNPKIEVIWNTEVKEVVGVQHAVSHLKLFNNQTQENSDLNVNGLFLAIGHIPVTNYLNNQLELTEMGYIKSPDGIATSVPGVFVCGDVQDHVYRQAITAAGMGCRASLEAQKYLEHLD